MNDDASGPDMEIKYLTIHQVKLLNKMWSIQSEEEYYQWEMGLSKEDRILTSTLQELMILELLDMQDEYPYTDETLEVINRCRYH